MPEPLHDDVVVLPWTDRPALPYHDEIWSVWLHGSVAAVRVAGRMLLMVPMAVATPAVTALALRLHKLGAVALLD